MALSSLQLEAFHAVARTGGFSRAAGELHITQSALSQRIANLEAELSLALFVREPRALRLTEAGERLLRHCQATGALEDELLRGLRGADLGGELRIGAYSSVARSVVLPALTGLLRAHPAARVELRIRELRELPGLLRSGAVDLILLDEAPARADVTAHRLGDEEYVLAEPRAGGAREIFLDHDPDDLTTERYLQKQGAAYARVPRDFVGGIDAILDGVALGWGRGVVPRHLLGGRRDLRMVAGRKALRRPVYLQYLTQSYYPALRRLAIDELIARAPARLTAW